MTAGRLWALTVLIGALLLASVVLAALRVGWHFQGHTSVLPAGVPAPNTVETEERQRDTSAIVALAPFGNTPSVVEAPSISTNGSKLDLALRGVLVDPNPNRSRAFIAADGNTAVFRVGEMVQTAELVAINADTITLKTDTGLQVVGFGGVQGGEQAATPQTPTENKTGDPFARLANAIVPGNGSIDLRDAPPPETTEDYITLWRDRIARNPQAAMDNVGLELVENGYKVKPNPNIGVTLAGLKAGDVVTRLNGQAVGDLDNDRELYDEVAAAGIARLEVLRDGQALLLTFPLR